VSSRSALAALITCLVLAGCGRSHDQPPPAGPGASLTGGTTGIAWHDGDVDSAFAAATASGRPVLLYWGAEWCPDCQQLKSSVFTRGDFIARTRLFVPVHLDGDLPGAQAWGDTFRVTGYPTLVVLTPDRREITRIAGGMDLNLYAAALDTALADARPVAEVVGRALAAGTVLGVDDCRRLAYHGYGLEDAEVFPPAILARALHNATDRCPPEPAELHNRLQLLAAAQAAGAAASRAAEADIVRPARDEALAALADDAAFGNVDVLNSFPAGFFAAVRTADPAGAAALGARWDAVARSAATDARFPPADQLFAERLRVVAAAGLAPDGKVPADLATTTLARADALLAQHPTGFVHASVVNAALTLYADLGEWERSRDLLEAEAATSRNAHYYLVHLAQVEEVLGHHDRALELYAEAWARSAGTATRAQWGYDYLRSLLRLAPDDTAAIAATGRDLLDGLGSRDNVHRRSRLRLAKLGTELAAWATTAERRAVLGQLSERLAEVCGAGGGPPEPSCATLLPAG
jgi:thiol-disulfide isomerase/thioredoxin